MNQTHLSSSKNFFLLILFFISSTSLFAQEDIIQNNDNSIAGGTLQENVLTIDLVADIGMWYPGGEDAHGLEIQAFREEGQPLQIPGPMIRVEEGTEVVATIRNAIPDFDLRFAGFQTRPAATQNEITIATGEVKTVRFTVGEPGIYFYAAATEAAVMQTRFRIDSQLSGAFIVDPVGYSGEDKVFVLHEYLRGIPPEIRVTGAQTAINGMTWPNSNIEEVEVGKLNRWHVINPSFSVHPMHLHGQHYRVTDEATMFTTTNHAIDLQEEVVTQFVPPMTAMTMEWAAVREGNWLFHCHITGHVSAAGMISVIGDAITPEGERRASKGMGGMVLGIHASDPRGLSTSTTAVAREITMLMEEQENYFQTNPGYTVGFSEGDKQLSQQIAPGSMLVLNKDEPVSINLINKLGQPTSIHWHGMELESYYDGVAGYSGNGTSITPIINPGESFEVKMTPPRAGTYFYHSHHNDSEQLMAGLYGAIIISDPEAPYQPDEEKVLVLGLIGKLFDQGLGINGQSNLVEEFQLNRNYKLRLVNITDRGGNLQLSVKSESGPTEWVAIAKDGADLPIGLQKPTSMNAQTFAVGEAYDFSWTPDALGTYQLEISGRRDGIISIVAKAELRVVP